MTMIPPQSDRYQKVVRTGTWLYNHQIAHKVEIVCQNWDRWFEEGFDTEPEPLNADGELFYVVLESGYGTGFHSAEAAITDAESKLALNNLQWNTEYRSSYSVISSSKRGSDMHLLQYPRGFFRPR